MSHARVTARLEEGSPARDSLLVDNKGRVKADFGVGAGLALFDGILAVGVSWLFLDKQDFTSGAPSRIQDFMFYTLNWQPVATVRAVLKRGKDPDQRNPR